MSSFSTDNTNFIVHKITFHVENALPIECAVLIDERMARFLPTDLPAQTHRTPTAPDDNTPCFEIRDAGVKGLGMFATRAIPAGALILVEHPAIVTPASLPLDPDIRNAAYRELFNVLRKDIQDELRTMASCRSQEECPTMEESIGRTNGSTIDLAFPAEMETDIDIEGRQYGAVSLKLNRSNHSCGPNAAYKWDLLTFASSFYALRPIFAGEEITMTYNDVTQPHAARQSRLLRLYGFHCTCTYCSLPPALIPASDLARAHLRDWHRTRPGYIKWARDLCRADDVVIASHMEALNLIEREGLHGFQRLFVEEICLCWAMVGEEGEFRKWAEMLLVLSEVPDPGLASQVRGWLEDPQRRVKKWGWRKKQRLQMNGRKRRNATEPPSPELSSSVLMF